MERLNQHGGLLPQLYNYIFRKNLYSGIKFQKTTIKMGNDKVTRFCKLYNICPK